MQFIEKYFPSLTDKQKKKFVAFSEVFRLWNSQVNLVSRKDMENLEERHILHSLAIAKIISFKKDTKIMDVGTGGGFPGIPLAIMFPYCDFLLVDSTGKKIKVVNAIVEELNLKNVIAKQIRAENVEQTFDFIVSRAVTRLPLFYELVNTKIKRQGFNEIPNGILYLKGGSFDEELASLTKSGKYKIFDIKNYFAEAFFNTKKIAHLY